MRTSRLLKQVTLLLLIFALHDYARCFEPPKFIVNSTPPEGLKLEVTGYVTLIIPHSEKQLLETPALKLTDRIIAACTDPTTQTAREASSIPASIDKSVFKSREHWMRFSLLADGENRRYKLFSMEGVPLRDESFDGKLSVHFFIDSGQANIFQGVSKYKYSIPSITEFYPVTRYIEKILDWKVENGIASAQVGDANACSAKLGASGFVERFTVVGDKIQDKAAIGWRKIAFYSIPTVVADLKGDEKSTHSVELTVIESCKPITGISESDLKVSAPKETTVVQDLRTLKLREDTDDLRKHAR